MTTIEVLDRLAVLCGQSWNVRVVPPDARKPLLSGAGIEQQPVVESFISTSRVRGYLHKQNRRLHSFKKGAFYEQIEAARLQSIGMLMQRINYRKGYGFIDLEQDYAGLGYLRAIEAVPVLCKVLEEDTRDAKAARDALIRIGNPALPYLSKRRHALDELAARNVSEVIAAIMDSRKTEPHYSESE
jgi:hypothetical protein